MMARLRAVVVALAVLAGPAAGQQEATGDLKELNLEQLMNVQFYTASKRAQNARDTPASVTVVTVRQLRLLQDGRGFRIKIVRVFSRD